MTFCTIRLFASCRGLPGRTLVTASRRISSSSNSQKNDLLFLPLLAVAGVAIGGTALLANEVRPTSGL